VIQESKCGSEVCRDRYDFGKCRQVTRVRQRVPGGGRYL